MERACADDAAIDLYGCMTPDILKVRLMLGEPDLSIQLHHVRIYRREQFADGFEAR